ncbi:MAG: hypothetical protein LBP87_06665 [Planctomycetaceae bacterium]|jgi:hypothetical protein|nr:hypothetical protein [Planctomycetaceae bacterium]
MDTQGVSYETLLYVFVGLVLKYDGFVKIFGALMTPQGVLGCYDSSFFLFIAEIQSLTETEKQLLLTRADELQDYDERRIKGAFYTPLQFVEMAHSILTSRLGDDWKEKYVVFDGTAGSRNLTKGYLFRELYSSTLDSLDVAMYPPLQGEGEFFQFDFLNDDESKLPQGLQEAFNCNKSILFFMNPPYFDIKRKKTLTTVQLRARRIGLSRTLDMSSLFFIRILLWIQKYHLTNVVFAVFCPVTYLSSTIFQKFRKLWCSHFKLDKAVLFSADYFADVSQDWAIQFAVWKSGQNPTTSEFRHTCIDIDDGKIVKIGKKTIYNFDTNNLDYPRLTMDWFNCSVKEPTRFMPGVTSQFKIVNSMDNRFVASNRVSADHLCAFCCSPTLSVHSTAIVRNQPGYNLNSSSLGTVEITPRNFERVVTVFAMARTVKHNWVTKKDYFHVPNENHPKWKQFVADSVVYSLFSNGSDLVSLYQIDYCGRFYDIPNEFFWVSIKNMRGLAEKYRNLKTLSRLRETILERYVYLWLREHIDEVSDEAIYLLEAGNKLLRNTFQYRLDFDKERPEIQICNWDAGWWQLKELWKSVDKSGFKELVKLRKELEHSIYSRSCELGWFRQD